MFVRRTGQNEWRHVVGVATGNSYGAFRRGVVFQVDDADANDPDLEITSAPPNSFAKSRHTSSSIGFGTLLQWVLALAGFQSCHRCAWLRDRMDHMGARWCRRHAFEIAPLMLDNLRKRDGWRERWLKTLPDKFLARLIRLFIIVMAMGFETVYEFKTITKAAKTNTRPDSAGLD